MLAVTDAGSEAVNAGERREERGRKRTKGKERERMKD